MQQDTIATLTSADFYDRLAALFDVMTDWPQRLAYEMPFLLRTLNSVRKDDRPAAQPLSVLDVACGTGWHAIALTQAGLQTAGADISPAMIAHARRNAAAANVTVPFTVSAFAELDQTIPLPQQFDAVLCLGNSLPHLLTAAALDDALRQMQRRLRPDGLLILQNLNYDLRLQKMPRFFDANGVADRLVWRFADYHDDGITFHTVLFEFRDGAWSRQVNSTRQRPWLAADLTSALTRAGFHQIHRFGGLDGSSFDPASSPDLILTAYHLNK